ncbi:uncharacterized protein [Amphiura filiformis]|uniref:uncharacterized protein n=1 Tax=Amphiura filiformis TaxID=82378 RepID=UPI003B223CAD
MYLRDVVDKSQLPQPVKFYAGDDLTFQLQLKNNTVAEKFSSVTLKNMYEVTYLQGNSIFHNHLDTMVVNIPLYAPIDVYIAEGFRTSTPEKWTKYQSLLGKLVGKHVTFELYPGNQNITYFSDKRLDKARTQEDYESIVPTGTLVINAGNTRLKHKGKGAAGASAGASKTLGASAASNGLAPSRKAPQAPSSNSNNSTFQGGTPHERRHSLLDEMDAADDRRIMSNAGATVPRSILRNEAKKHAAEEAAGTTEEEDTVPLGEDAASMNHRLMLRRQSVGDIPSAVHHHTPISHTPEPVRKHSTPVAPLQLQSQWHQRQQQLQQQKSLDSPRSIGSSNPSFDNNGGGGGSAMHTSASTPSFGSSPSAARHSRHISAPSGPSKIAHRSPSSAGTASIHSENDNVFSGLAPPVDIPAPDYNEAPPLPSKSAAATRPPMTHWGSFPERAEPPNHHINERPPSPPPISTIPTRQAQSSMPNRFAPSPPSSSGAPPPPAPPPPGVPPAPPAAPPPPGVPPPPGAPPPPPPPPPLDGGSAPAPGSLAASIANAQLKPASQRAERPPPPPKEESPMNNMMRELKAVQERRKSMGDVLANDTVEKMSTGSSGSGSEQTELQKAMERRNLKLGNFNAGPRAPPNPLPKANTSKPRFNANNSPRNNFKVINNNNAGRVIHSMSDVPTDLKSLTMNEVIQILKLMNLGKYEGRFKEHCIDGDMLVTLTREILKSDLGFSSELDVNKILKFIKGWRPK